MELRLQPGEKVYITLADSDGEFIISYGDEAVTVNVDLPDTSGRVGLIYNEVFGSAEETKEIESPVEVHEQFSIDLSLVDYQGAGLSALWATLLDQRVLVDFYDIRNPLPELNLSNVALFPNAQIRWVIDQMGSVSGVTSKVPGFPVATFELSKITEGNIRMHVYEGDASAKRQLLAVIDGEIDFLKNVAEIYFSYMQLKKCEDEYLLWRPNGKLISTMAQSGNHMFFIREETLHYCNTEDVGNLEALVQDPDIGVLLRAAEVMHDKAVSGHAEIVS